MCSTEITKALWSEVVISSLQVGFNPEGVRALSMFAGGYMSMLLKRVDTNTLRLIRSWRINTMLCYLCTSAQTFIEGLVA